MPNIGPLELLVVLGIVLVLFGAKKLPLLGRGLGEGIRNFRTGLKGDPAKSSTEADPSHPD